MKKRKKPKGGRPNMDLSEKRKLFPLYLTDTEKEQLFRDTKVLERGSVSALIRERIFQKNKVPEVNQKELFAKMDYLGAQTLKIGNNINQMARAMNQMALSNKVDPGHEDQIKNLLSEYVKLQKDIKNCFNELLLK